MGACLTENSVCIGLYINSYACISTPIFFRLLKCNISWCNFVLCPIQRRDKSTARFLSIVFSVTQHIHLQVLYCNLRLYLALCRRHHQLAHTCREMVKPGLSAHTCTSKHSGPTQWRIQNFEKGRARFSTSWGQAPTGIQERSPRKQESEAADSQKLNSFAYLKADVVPSFVRRTPRQVPGGR